MSHLLPTSAAVTSGERDANQPRARDRAEHAFPDVTNSVDLGEAD
jgi:hypothetical protein